MRLNSPGTQATDAYADLSSFETIQPPQPQQQFRMAPTPQYQPQQFQPQQPVKPQQVMVHQEMQSRLALPSQVKLHLVMVMASYPLPLIQNLDNSTEKQQTLCDDFKALYPSYRLVD